jgi:hypothetical protein
MASWPIDGLRHNAKIAPQESITDVVAFAVPSSTSEEIDIFLPAENLGMSESFRFKIGRPFFENK